MARENYAACVKFVRKAEGGNTDTPGDRGGRTGRGGITRATYDAYRDSKRLQRQDVWLICDLEISEIYKSRYWVPIHGDDLPVGVDLCLFDYAIHSGPAKANQERLLAGSGDAQTLIHKICANRLSFMHALASWSLFGVAWGRRVADCEATALTMAGALTPATAVVAAEARNTHKKKGARAVVAGVAVASAVRHFGYVNHEILMTILGVAVLGAAIAIFNAWRQGQRADALTSAVQRLQATQTAAAAARSAVAAQVSAKEQAIAAEQVVLSSAKDAISKAMSVPPPPRDASAVQP